MHTNVAQHPAMRRKDRALAHEEALSFLCAGEYGILSTLSQDGSVYGVPLSFVVSGNTLYFHGTTTGHKIDNIKHHAQASFCVVGGTKPIFVGIGFSTLYTSVIAFGTMAMVSDTAEKETALGLLAQKYFPEYAAEALTFIQKDGKRTAVFKMDITRLSGKKRLPQ